MMFGLLVARVVVRSNCIIRTCGRYISTHLAALDRRNFTTGEKYVPCFRYWAGAEHMHSALKRYVLERKWDDACSALNLALVLLTRCWYATACERIA
jgi:hypothetical protein